MTTFDGADTSAKLEAGADATALFDLPPSLSSALRHSAVGGRVSARTELALLTMTPQLVSAQWRAETFQLVNWGGFQGRHLFTFAPGATLISGASGTGKSTLLDAYIALMMPSDTSFNGASNDAGTGKARSADQRNLISYLRGKFDTTSDEGREVDKVLRGETTATWGAVGMTFVSDEGQRFTALRVYYLPARATRVGELTMRRATIDGPLDLVLLEGLVPSGGAPDKFAPRSLKDAFPGMRTYETHSTFAQALYTRLGIGANGDGEKALRLLARIQAGYQITTVDALYKSMVLERPATYAAADRAIEHFDALEGAYAEMVTEQRKANLLEGITERQAVIDRCRQSMQRLDMLGVNEGHPRTPYGLWMLRTKARILDDTVDANRQERVRTGGLLTQAQADEKRVRDELARAEEQHRDAGGQAVERLEADITAARHERDIRRGQRNQLVSEIAVLNAPLDTPEDHARLLAEADSFLSSVASIERETQDRRDSLRDEQRPLLDRKRQLEDEQRSLAGRQGRVDKQLDDARRVLAQAAGIDVSDLPFVAELIDVLPEEGRWRLAIETVLYGAARTLLVPQEHLDRFSAAIDSVRLPIRITFEGADRTTHRDVTYDHQYIAGKLAYKDSPYSSWVAEFLRDRRRNALCVESATELSGGGNETRVTAAGQTRRGRSGAHGQRTRSNIIGFSNEDALADIAAELADLEQRIRDIDARLRVVEADRDSVGRRQSAYQAARQYTWAHIDDAGAQADIARLTKQLDQLLSGNDRLSELTQLIAKYRADLDDAIIARGAFEKEIGELKAEQADLCTKQDANTSELDDLEGPGEVLLVTEDADYLDTEFTDAASGSPYRLDTLDENFRSLGRRFRDKQNADRETRTAAEGTLALIFRQYQDQWPDPNLGDTAEAYPEYSAILANILQVGLHERRARWRRQLTSWSGEDLVPLSHALDSAIEDIEDRLQPINAILAKLPFGASHNRLRIKLRKLTRDNVVSFRRELRRLAGTATGDLPDDQTEQRFLELQTFMARIRPRDDLQLRTEHRDLWDRDNLLDVRKHVEVTAERYDHETDELLSTHSSLVGKSGGESQELVAFIIGAALRFRLGDETRDRPRFAPVFLDEGFVKADSEFAARAVQAWKGLGFQLIVGAPLDKVPALEKHMDEMLCIVKNLDTNLSYVNRLRAVDLSGAVPEPGLPAAKGEVSR